MNGTIYFGSTLLPLTISPATITGGRAPELLDVSGQAGAALAGDRLKERTITLRGGLQADTPDDLRTAIDTLRAALNKGQQYLTFDSVRRVLATVTDFTTDYDPTSFKRYCGIAITFAAASTWESVDESLLTWNAPASGGMAYIDATAWKAPMPARLELVMAGTDTVRYLFTLDGSLLYVEGTLQAGWTYALDAGTGRVIGIDGSSVEHDCSSLLSGKLLTIPAATESYVTYNRLTGTTDPATIRVRWHGRWY